MKNLLKMDIYRMIRSKSAYIIAAIAVLLVAMNIFTTRFAVQVIKGDFNTQSTVTSDGVALEGEASGVSFEGLVSKDFHENIINNKQIPLSYFLELMNQGLTKLMLLGIFVAIFVNAEQKHGFNKNLASKVKNRGNLIVSKLIACSIYAVALSLVVDLATAGFSKLFFGYISFEGFSQITPYLLIQILIPIAFACFIAMLAIWFKSSGYSMLVGIVIGSGISQLIAQGINQIVQNFLKWEKFDICKVFISSYSYGFTMKSSNSQYIWAVAVGVTYLVISAIAAYTIMKKRDIN